MKAFKTNSMLGNSQLGHISCRVVYLKTLNSRQIGDLRRTQHLKKAILSP